MRFLLYTRKEERKKRGSRGIFIYFIAEEEEPREKERIERRKKTHSRNHRKIAADPPSAFEFLAVSTLRLAGTPAFRLLPRRWDSTSPSAAASRFVGDKDGAPWRGIGIIEIHTVWLKDSPQRRDLDLIWPDLWVGHVMSCSSDRRRSDARVFRGGSLNWRLSSS